MTTDQEVIEMIGRMKDRLWEKGWHKHTLGVSEGPNCLVGAASFEMRRLSEARADVWPALWKALRPRIGNPTEWNDAPERTFEDVIEMLDDTIVAIKMGDGP